MKLQKVQLLLENTGITIFCISCATVSYHRLDYILINDFWHKLESQWSTGYNGKWFLCTGALDVNYKIYTLKLKIWGFNPSAYNGFYRNDCNA